MIRTSVECYAGYRGEETPVRFQLGDRVIEIDEVLDRWLAPDHRYFKMRTAEGTYILRNDTTSGRMGIGVVHGVAPATGRRGSLPGPVAGKFAATTAPPMFLSENWKTLRD